jgi:hypothetical protein
MATTKTECWIAGPCHCFFCRNARACCDLISGCACACICGSPAFFSDLYCSRTLSPLSTAFTRYLHTLAPATKQNLQSQFQKDIFKTAYQPFRHCDVITASFPTNLSGVLLFPCIIKESASQQIGSVLGPFFMVTVTNNAFPMYHDQDSLPHGKWVLHPLQCSGAFSI